MGGKKWVGRFSFFAGCMLELLGRFGTGENAAHSDEDEAKTKKEEEGDISEEEEENVILRRRGKTT